MTRNTSTGFVAALRVAQFLLPLILGAIVGAVGVMLLLQQEAKAFAWIATAAATAIVFCLVGFVLTRATQTYLRSKLMVTDSSSWAATVRPVLLRIYDEPTAERLAQTIAEKGPLIVQSITAASASAYAIGLAVSLSAGLVALGGTVASYQQVEKMERQNKLIEEQTVVARLQKDMLEKQMEQDLASQTSTYYLSQLDTVVRLLEEHRTQHDRQLADLLRERTTDPETFDEDAFWTALDASGIGEASSPLLARIGALASSVQSYRKDPEAQGRVFSPQKGHLLSVLVEHGIRNLSSIDFSEADLRGLVLDEAHLLDQPLRPAVQEIFDSWTNDRRSLTPFNLSRANLRDTRLENVSLGRADLRDAILPDLPNIGATIGRTSGFLSPMQGTLSSWGTDRLAHRFGKWVRPSFLYAEVDQPLASHVGAQLEGAIVPRADWLEQVRKIVGPSGINFSLWKTTPSGNRWRLTIDPVSAELASAIEQIEPYAWYECTTKRDVDELLRAPLKRAAKASRQQTLDKWRPYSREQGLLIINAAMHDGTSCLTDLKANVSHSFLGYDLSHIDTFDLSGLDLRYSTFERARVNTLVLDKARLPPASALAGVVIETGLSLNDAVAPSADWAAQVAKLIRVPQARPATGYLPCTRLKDAAPCKSLAEARLILSDSN